MKEATLSTQPEQPETPELVEPFPGFEYDHDGPAKLGAALEAFKAAAQTDEARWVLAAVAGNALCWERLTKQRKDAIDALATLEAALLEPLVGDHHTKRQGRVALTQTPSGGISAGDAAEGDNTKRQGKEDDDPEGFISPSAPLSP
jgi:hypothetical protein